MNPYVTKSVGFKSNRNKPCAVSNAFQKRRKQNGLVVAISRANFQQRDGIMQEFNAVRILNISDFVAHKRVEPSRLPNEILLLQA